MGIQSTLHITEEKAQAAYRKAINPDADAAFFRQHGWKHFEKMLDWILAETFYNVSLIEQDAMDKAMADHYERTFGNYDPDGLTLEHELHKVVRSEGMHYVNSQLDRLNAKERR